MIEIKLTEDIITRAKGKAKDVPVTNNTIIGGKGRLAGFIGEEVVKEFLNATEDNTYEYDLDIMGVKIDVKTKQCKSKPKDYYECSVANYYKQDCDLYVFVRTSPVNNPTKAWILGWDTKDDYNDDGRHLKKGELDGDNGFVVKSDCINKEIKSLRAIEELKDIVDSYKNQNLTK